MGYIVQIMGLCNESEAWFTRKTKKPGMERPGQPLVCCVIWEKSLSFSGIAPPICSVPFLGHLHYFAISVYYLEAYLFNLFFL